MDEIKRKLERRATAGQDPSLETKIIAENDRRGLAEDDAAYFMAYLDMCEAAIKLKWTAEDATLALAELNSAWRLKVTSKTLRDAIATVAARDEGYDDGLDEGRAWSSSSSC